MAGQKLSVDTVLIVKRIGSPNQNNVSYFNRSPLSEPALEQLNPNVFRQSLELQECLWRSVMICLERATHQQSPLNFEAKSSVRWERSKPLKCTEKSEQCGPFTSESDVDVEKPPSRSTAHALVQ